MGVTIRCKKTSRSIDMGYSGFCRLRTQVATLSSPEFGSQYKLRHSPSAMPVFGEATKEAFCEKFDQEIDRLLAQKKVSIKVVDFCLQSDCSGRIRYGACKEILKAVNDYDDDICYGYIGRPDCAKFKDFKQILKDCAENKCDLVWK